MYILSGSVSEALREGRWRWVRAAASALTWGGRAHGLHATSEKLLRIYYRSGDLNI